MAHILKDGQKIREAYEVEKFLGEGAFAEVYRVRHCMVMCPDRC